MSCFIIVLQMHADSDYAQRWHLEYLTYLNSQHSHRQSVTMEELDPFDLLGIDDDSELYSSIL